MPINTQQLYCPSCAHPSLQVKNDKAFTCTHCEFTYFHNTASAVMAVICYQDNVLVAVRGREPGKGMLDFPGGFVDYNESLEQALCRELQEELGFQPTQYRYIGSAPNTYRYRNIEYNTCDVFFHIELDHQPAMQAADDVSAIYWVPVNDLNLDKFAFDSAKQALCILGLVMPD